MEKVNNKPAESIFQNIFLKKIPNSKEEIIKWLTGEYKGKYKETNDISYEMWVSKDNNVRTLCKEFEISKNKANDEILDRHDYCCELRLLKCITEDQAHKDKLYPLTEKYTHLNNNPELIPYEYNSVYYSSPEKIDTYINASFIDGPFYNNHKLFIATQNPLNHTIEHFWQMVIYNNARAIIMFSSTNEELRNKGECYWPKKVNSPITLGNIVIELIEPSIPVILNYLYINKFKLQNKERQKETIVTQLIVTCWNEHSVLRSDLETNIMKELFSQVEECNSNNPCVVHCNDGVGRTGVFIALFNIYKCLIEQMKSKIEPVTMNVFNLVRCLREQRFGIIGELVHYQYLYNFTINLIQKLEDKQFRN